MTANTAPAAVPLTGVPLIHSGLVVPETDESRAGRYIAGLTRIALSTIFLWAFLDKMFGLGHETKAGKGWLDGGSPTTGFLKGAAVGPLKGFYNSLAGIGFLDWLFMAALLGIGLGLLLGVAMRVTAVSATALLVMMWSAALPPANHIFMDDHLIYALVIIGLALTGGGRTLGLGGAWARLPIVQRYRALI